MPITLADYYMGRDQLYPDELTDALRADAAETVRRVNRLLEKAKIEKPRVSSGWRPLAVNAKTQGAAKKSHHTLCRACDLADPKGDIGHWCLTNLKALEAIGLWLEHPSKTPTWCHLQIVPPKSGRRVFMP